MRRLQLLTFALPTTDSQSMAKNEIFKIISKDQVTQQSKPLITSLLIFWSNIHIELNKINKDKTS